MKSYFVYILANQKNGTLYIGVTNDLRRRVLEHKSDLVEGFTKAYKVRSLVYFEETNDIKIAISREKALKKWNRKWKLELIEKTNPEWRDLSIEDAKGILGFPIGVGNDTPVGRVERYMTPSHGV